MNWSSNLAQSLKQRAVALGEIAASHLFGLYVQQGWQAEQGRFKILRRRVTWVAPPRQELLWSAAMKLSLSDHLVFLLLAQAGPISAVFLFNYCDANCINTRGSTCTSDKLKQLKVGSWRTVTEKTLLPGHPDSETQNKTEKKNPRILTAQQLQSSVRKLSEMSTGAMEVYIYIYVFSSLVFYRVPRGC